LVELSPSASYVGEASWHGPIPGIPSYTVPFCWRVKIWSEQSEGEVPESNLSQNM